MSIAERTPITLGSPTNRAQYVAECQANIARFKETHPLHWIEYVRGKRPVNHAELLKLKKWAATSSSILVDSQSAVPLIHQLVDEKLQDYRRPRGVVVAAIVLGKLYVSDSLCNFTAGDQWSKPIGLWKAMHKIAGLKILPCPTVKIEDEEAEEGTLVVVPHLTEEVMSWALQYPASSYDTVIRLATRIFEQHITDESVRLSELLPVRAEFGRSKCEVCVVDA